MKLTTILTTLASVSFITAAPSGSIQARMEHEGAASPGWSGWRSARSHMSPEREASPSGQLLLEGPASPQAHTSPDHAAFPRGQLLLEGPGSPRAQTSPEGTTSPRGQLLLEGPEPVPGRRGPKISWRKEALEKLPKDSPEYTREALEGHACLAAERARCKAAIITSGPHDGEESERKKYGKHFFMDTDRVGVMKVHTKGSTAAFSYKEPNADYHAHFRADRYGTPVWTHLITPSSEGPSSSRPKSGKSQH